MKSTVIAVDLAKNVLEVAIATHTGKFLERQRLNRTQSASLLVRREPTNEERRLLLPMFLTKT